MKFKRSRKSTSFSSMKLHYAETAWHHVAAKHITEWDFPWTWRPQRGKRTHQLNPTSWVNVATHQYKLPV